MASTTSTSSQLIDFKIYDQRTVVFQSQIVGSLVLGRQRVGEPAPFVLVPGTDHQRCIISGTQDVAISREHMRLDPTTDGRLYVINLSVKNSVVLGKGELLRPGKDMIVDFPFSFELGGKTIRLEPAEEEVNYATLPQPTMAPGSNRRSDSSHLMKSYSADSVEASLNITGPDLMEWMMDLIGVFQSVSTGSDFLQRASDAALRQVDLDVVAVMVLVNGVWMKRAISTSAHLSFDTNAWQPSLTILERIKVGKRTFYNRPASNQSSSQDSVPSLLGVQVLIASPILSQNSDVLGALYGERRSRNLLRQLEYISLPQAQLFDLLAYGIANGMARVEQERQLIAERVRFEQFFTPELARSLEKGGDELLAPREQEVSVLFCDIRGFSRISARCSAQVTIEWIRDVLSVLSDCVAAHEGVLVDYSGDAIEALWGAPNPTTDHALRACQCALSMRAKLDEINEQWAPRIGEYTDVSIGIHTGKAQVGNIGSRRKFKYGAFGTTVNLASRVQGATKYLGMSVLITKSTVAALPTNAAVRRLATIRAVNIEAPQEVYELAESTDELWLRLKHAYEKGLQLFEHQKFHEALAQIAGIPLEYPHDMPTQILLMRCLQHMSNPPEQFTPVWTLDSK